MKRLLGLVLLLGLVFGVSAADTPQTLLVKGDDESSLKDQADKKQPTRTFGSGSKPAPPSTPKPAPPKSFGSGSTPKPPTPPPSTPVTPAPPKSFGSGSTPKPPDNKAPPKSFGSGTPKPADPGTKPGTAPGVTPPKFGSGNTPGTAPGAGTKPGTAPKFDNKAANAQKKEESKAAFQKGKEPATSYVDPKGNTVKIDPKDQKIQSLRNQLSEEKWRTREARQQTFYATYYSRPVVVYHDPYGHLFWYWMLDRSIEQQALWAYHHRQSMDAARYNDMLAKNAELAARVRALEQQGVQRNPTYQPTGMADNDLMYNDNYVKAVYNPAPVPVQHPHRVDDGSALRIMLYVFLGLGIVALIVWLLFVKKW